MINHVLGFIILVFTVVSGISIFLDVRNDINLKCPKDKVYVGDSAYNTCVLENTPTVLIDSVAEYTVTLIAGSN